MSGMAGVTRKAVAVEGLVGSAVVVNLLIALNRLEMNHTEDIAPTKVVPTKVVNEPDKNTVRMAKSTKKMMTFVDSFLGSLLRRKNWTQTISGFWTTSGTPRRSSNSGMTKKAFARLSSHDTS